MYKQAYEAAMFTRILVQFMDMETFLAFIDFIERFTARAKAGNMNSMEDLQALAIEMATDMLADED